MRKLLVLMFTLACHFAWAEMPIFKLASNESIDLDKVAAPIVKALNAAPMESPIFGLGVVFVLDEKKYFVQPTMFMKKSAPDEVCTATGKVLAYQCKEGQRVTSGCHLLFFDAQGKSVGFHTMNIREESPYYCNAMPALGVADKKKNELLVTMQYFSIDGKGATKISEVGNDWLRMTTLFRVKDNHGKIEVEQDDTCLGNPNRFDTVAKARKQIQRCGAASK